MMLDDLKARLKTMAERLEQLRGYLDVDKKGARIKDIEGRMSHPQFWKDSKKAQELIGELKGLRNSCLGWKKAKEQHADLEELAEVVESEDTSSLEYLDRDLRQLSSDIDKLEFTTLLSGEEDKNNAILSIHAGAGGTESCDWTGMLARMYLRWTERKGFVASTLDFLPGEEAGTKNITILIKGEYAYGYLKAESGVHRLVRISPFDANKRRHTSFASVDVIAEISDEIKVEIKPEDLKIDTFRSSGAGGQHVNVTDSAVRITHLPTGIIVQCQNERSQFKNKSQALKVLRARLHEREKEEQRKKLEAGYAAKQDIAWGSQIRSYVLHPYTMVKDHRTNYEKGNASGVLDGDIDEFIEAYLKWKVKK
ncbi:MAG: peptide chain release factor 2 [Candidatus Omnitrophota bacterium]|nr:MAG: peptide chain release factor 2 [Candidatus Omnitrophota bacterium]